MDIKTLSIAALIGFCTLTPVKADIPKNFDSYMSAALEVYRDYVQPSVKNSELFYSYLEYKWKFERCKSDTDCYQSGIKVAKEFAQNQVTFVRL